VLACDFLGAALSQVHGFSSAGLPSAGLRSGAASRGVALCSAKQDLGAGATRRDALRFLGTGAAAMSGLVLPGVQQTGWEAFAEDRRTGSGETKAELLALAKDAAVTLKSMNDPVEVAAGAYIVSKEDAQKTFYLLQRSLSSGSVSLVRKTCFHLYREHVVDAKLYKDAEESYKVMTRALDKLNSDLIKASRGEFQEKDLSRILPELVAVQQSLDAYIKLFG